MPIYAYKCESCGFAKDMLQKMSDAPLTECPSCGASAFRKQLTAAGFQLKGSGWYVTDFRGGAGTNSSGAEEGKSSSVTDAKRDGQAGTSTEAKETTKPTEAATSAPKKESTSASVTPAPTPSGPTK